MSQVFVDRLEKDIKCIYNKFKFSKKMILTEQDKNDLKKATHCHICERELGRDRVRDHVIYPVNLGERLATIATLIIKTPSFSR